MITPRKAEILGLICSDGNYRHYKTNYIEFDKRKNLHYPRKQIKRIIEFANTNIPLLKYFIKLLVEEFEYEPKITLSNKNVFRVCITKNSVIDDLLEHGKFGTLTWKVPEIILQGNQEMQTAFIRGFFDGDGSVDLMNKKLPRVRINSTNPKGLKQLNQLLQNLNIGAKINGPYKSKRQDRKFVYELLLGSESIIRFIKLIGSNHSKKKNIFNEITLRHQGLIKDEDNPPMPGSPKLVGHQLGLKNLGEP